MQTCISKINNTLHDFFFTLFVVFFNCFSDSPSSAKRFALKQLFKCNLRALKFIIGRVYHEIGLYIVYKNMLLHSHRQIRFVFSFLSLTDRYPILIHCMIGKDRTGVLVALILTFCGWDAESVAENFALSDEYLAPVLDHLIADGEDIGLPKDSHVLFSSKDTMLQVIKFLNENYGNVYAYLNRIGVNWNQQKKLIEKLLLHNDDIQRIKKKMDKLQKEEKESKEKEYYRKTRVKLLVYAALFVMLVLVCTIFIILF